jgi:1-acyl-sn-glycerol-3-phosphate acyltransferase
MEARLREGAGRVSKVGGQLSQWRGGYNHAQLEPKRRVLRWMIDNIAFRLLVRIDSVQGIENLPAHGAAIIMINHIAFVDPVVVMGVLPRNIVPLAKVEVYRYPVFGIFPWLWEVIPVHRGDFDRKALRSAEEVLRAGEVILVAPEGTRHPAMQAGKEGIAFLAHRTGAPIIPVTVEGTEGFPTLPIAGRWRRPGAQIHVGKPFRLVDYGERPSRETLRQMTDQAMGVLARMLPERRQGVYGNPEKIASDMLEFA